MHLQVSLEVNDAGVDEVAQEKRQGHYPKQVDGSGRLEEPGDDGSKGKEKPRYRQPSHEIQRPNGAQIIIYVVLLLDEGGDDTCACEDVQEQPDGQGDGERAEIVGQEQSNEDQRPNQAEGADEKPSREAPRDGVGQPQGQAFAWMQDSVSQADGDYFLGRRALSVRRSAIRVSLTS